MDRLWAPWRMEYVGAAQAEGCIFCTKPVENRDEENLILTRGNHAFLMMNIFPYNNGHLMAAPFRHVADLSQIRSDEMLDLMQMVLVGKEALLRAFSPDGFNIGINVGRVAGAGIVDMGKLASYVLQMGFGVKNPDEFINAAPQQQGMPPQGGQPSVPAEDGSALMSPEIMAMLQQQPPQ